MKYRIDSWLNDNLWMEYSGETKSPFALSILIAEACGIVNKKEVHIVDDDGVLHIYEVWGEMEYVAHSRKKEG